MRRLQFILYIIYAMIFFGCSNIAIPEKELVYNAILIDDSKSLATYLSQGFSPNYKDNISGSLIGQAVKNNSLESLKILVSKNNDLNSEFLIFKIESIEALKILVDAGADINIIGEKRDTPIISFIKNNSLSYVEYLLKKKADLNKVGKENWTPIFVATVYSNDIMIDLLIKYGANPLAIDMNLNYPIYYANRDRNIERLIDFKYDVSQKNIWGENVLGAVYLNAVKKNQIKIVDSFLKKKVDKNYKMYGISSYDIAKNEENIEILNLLLRYGVKK
ncbi:MAG: ankyrin repeat domain-containing protein [Fusobacteriaceae bacterium]